ncbi:MAG: cobalamin-dependent protein, partial [Methylobacterium sp.]|nr:cobalamin-dependent protein [Methylobacterium sp.]
ESDNLSFAEVSLGLVTLQRVLHEFAPPSSALPLGARRMLLVPMPGEVHGFGVRMLGIRFQQAGWDCQSEQQLSEEALLRCVGKQRYDVVGLSVQCAGDEDRAAGLILRIRKASCEPRVRILLGGSRFAGRPGVALALGADLAPLPFAELSEALDRLIPAS